MEQLEDSNRRRPLEKAISQDPTCFIDVFNNEAELEI